MYLDSVEHPDKYDPVVLSLLSDLAGSHRKPTDDEVVLLDKAVVDFSAMPPLKQAVRSQPKAVKAMSKPTIHKVEKYPDTPGDLVHPFWWKR